MVVTYFISKYILNVYLNCIYLKATFLVGLLRVIWAGMGRWVEDRVVVDVVSETAVAVVAVWVTSVGVGGLETVVGLSVFKAVVIEKEVMEVVTVMVVAAVVEVVVVGSALANTL